MNMYKKNNSPRWIPLSWGFIGLFGVLLIYYFWGFSLITFLLTLVPSFLCFSGLRVGLFGSDSLINKKVSSIPNKYLEIMDSDNIDLDQVYINLDYLEEAKKNLLYPKEILVRFVKSVSAEASNAKLLEKRISYSQRQEYLLNNATPAVIKIAYNLLLPGSGKEFLPGFLGNNPEKLFWFISAYPDVIGFFYPFRDFLSEEYEVDPEGYIKSFWVNHGESSKVLDSFEEYIGKKYTSDGGNDALELNDMVIELKNYHKSHLHKKYTLEK